MLVYNFNIVETGGFTVDTIRTEIPIDDGNGNITKLIQFSLEIQPKPGVFIDHIIKKDINDDKNYNDDDVLIEHYIDSTENQILPHFDYDKKVFVTTTLFSYYENNVDNNHQHGGQDSECTCEIYITSVSVPQIDVEIHSSTINQVEICGYNRWNYTLQFNDNTKNITRTSIKTVKFNKIDTSYYFISLPKNAMNSHAICFGIAQGKTNSDNNSYYSYIRNYINSTNNTINNILEVVSSMEEDGVRIQKLYIFIDRILGSVLLQSNDTIGLNWLTTKFNKDAENSHGIFDSPNYNELNLLNTIELHKFSTLNKNSYIQQELGIKNDRLLFEIDQNLGVMVNQQALAEGSIDNAISFNKIFVLHTYDEDNNYTGPKYVNANEKIDDFDITSITRKNPTIYFNNPINMQPLFNHDIKFITIRYDKNANGPFSDNENNHPIYATMKDWFNDIYKWSFEDIKITEGKRKIGSRALKYADATNTKLLIINILAHGGVFDDGEFAIIGKHNNNNVVMDISGILKNIKNVENVLIFCASCYGGGILYPGKQTYPKLFPLLNQQLGSSNIKNIMYYVLDTANSPGWFRGYSTLGNDIVTNMLLSDNLVHTTYAQFIDNFNTIITNAKKEFFCQKLKHMINEIYDVLVEELHLTKDSEYVRKYININNTAEFTTTMVECDGKTLLDPAVKSNWKNMNDNIVLNDIKQFGIQYFNRDFISTTTFDLIYFITILFEPTNILLALEDKPRSKFEKIYALIVKAYNNNFDIDTCSKFIREIIDNFGNKMNFNSIPAETEQRPTNKIIREFMLKQIIKIAQIMNKYMPIIVSNVVDVIQPYVNVQLALQNNTDTKMLYILNIMHDFPRMGFIKCSNEFKNYSFLTYRQQDNEDQT